MTVTICIVKTRHLSAACLLLLFYWAISVHDLAVVPRVYEDEPWQASTGWKLAQKGVFGTDVFAGYFGMERHYYGYLPLHPFFLAVIFKAGGLGLFQARLEPVIMGALTLALTFALGRRLFGSAVGLLATYILLVTRLTTATPSQITGIVFVDIARIARYDMVVPVFGLASLHVYLTAVRRRTEPSLYAMAGFLTGLASLSHLYGVFFAGALGLLGLWQRVGRRQLLALVLGFLLPWLPYLAYVLAGRSDWRGQTREYSPRFELLNLRWYLDNLRREPLRYETGLGRLGWDHLRRPGYLAAVVAVPLSMKTLGQRVWRAGRSGHPSSAVLFIPSLLLPIAFALLIYLKLINYLVAFLPLLALVVSWAAANWWRGPSLTRVLLALVLLVITVEGAARLLVLARAQDALTPYDVYIARVRSHLPDEARVLGLHNYWFGLDDYDYRSWAVPLLQRSSHFQTPPLTIGETLTSLEPDIILVDRRMRAFFADDPETAAAVWEWMDGRDFTRTGTVNDATYGQMEIYRKR